VAIDTIQQAIEELRTSVRGLALGKGLSFPVTALEQVVTASRPELGVVPDLLLRGDLGRLPEAVVREVLAVLVELLAGVGRKDGVRSVRVTVTASPGSVGLRVADDGTGPALHEREADLAGLRIRVHSLGGRLTDRRRPVGGSVVTLRLPLPLGPPDVTQPASVMPVREAG
jgi:signal transduction histidine kinase